MGGLTLRELLEVLVLVEENW